MQLVKVLVVMWGTGEEVVLQQCLIVKINVVQFSRSRKLLSVFLRCAGLMRMEQARPGEVRSGLDTPGKGWKRR